MVRNFTVSDSGPGPISFETLMALEETSPDVFESLTPAWPSATPNIVRAFGGHVYAQAVLAASRTVPQGLTVHNVTGHFILPGDHRTPFVYRVRRVRDGGIYYLRSVDVFQDPSPTPSFVATISFKRDEKSKKWLPSEHQNVARNHLWTEYAGVLNGIKPEDHPISPDADAIWWTAKADKDWPHAANNFPGVEVRKVDMAKYNGVAEEGGGGGDGSGASTRWRQLCFYRLIPSGNRTEVNELNLHAAAHMYASDRNSLFLIPPALGYATKTTTMGSLAHTVVLHGPAHHLRMTDDSGNPKWFAQEAWTSHSGGNRGLHESRLWDYESGRVIATTVQDGMIRIPVENERTDGAEGKAQSKL